MKIGALRESDSNESRVALVPETVERLVKTGHEVFIENGAGIAAGFPDQAYAKAGAKTVPAIEVSKSIDVFVHVQPPTADEINALKIGCLIVSMFNARNDASNMSILASAGATAIAMELVPRIARANGRPIITSINIGLQSRSPCCECLR